MKDSEPFRPVTIRGMLLAAAAAAAAATAIGFLGRFWWFFDLFSHFRVQYLVTSGIAAGVLLAIGPRRHALACAVVAAANLAAVVPAYLPQKAAAGAGAVRSRAMLVNVNTELGRPDRVARAILEADPDVLVLLEISDRWVLELEPALEGFRERVVRTRDDNFGIGLFSKHPVNDARIVPFGDAALPSVVADVVIRDSALTVIGTHPFPPVGGEAARARDRHLAALPELVSATKGPVLLLGDLNVTPWNFRFRRLLRETGLRDSAAGSWIRPTWPAGNWLARIPIDHCLHADSITILGRRVGPAVGSDHLPVIVDFSLPSTTRGDGCRLRAVVARCRMILEVHPVLPSRNVTAAVEFYVAKLGFSRTFQDGENPRYAGVTRDGVELHLQWHDPEEWARVERPMLRFWVDDVDALFEEYRARDVFSAKIEVRDTAWGTREFAFFDPDGNGLTFYQDLEAA